MAKKIIVRLLAIISFLTLLSLGIWLYNPVATLLSVKKLNDYPFYSLTYYGGASQNLNKIAQLEAFFHRLNVPTAQLARPSFACSLFFSAADPADMQYGRNFDWQYSPAVLVTYQQPGGNKSIAIANLQWLGYSVQDAINLGQLSLFDRMPLLASPYVLTDGMNSAGVVVGMAAVPDRGELFDPQKATMDSLEAMRMILDRANNTQDAVLILQNQNIDMGGGPAVHYLIADAQGSSVLVEITRDGFFQVVPRQNYQAATNHYLSDPPEKQMACQRLEAMNTVLQQADGRLLPGEAMLLLAQVSQPSTQWSVVYHNISGQMEIVTDLNYDQPLLLQLKMR